MRSPFQFIVKPLGGRRYDNIRKYGEVDFIISSDQEDHTVTNRFGKVISTPLNYKGEINPGDTLLVHHNVFRKYYDMKGRERSSYSFFRDDLFFIDDNQYFLYKHKGKWKAPNPYCFVEPIANEEYNVFTANLENHIEKGLVGKIKYINSELESFGLKEGDTISFQPESEYEFKVEGKKLYRMMTLNICVQI
tara:strand:- start:2028 stop:2603 length:576 start_codon:yes stop_codon:yes gene_type:complete